MLHGRGNGRGHATRMGALGRALQSLGAETRLVVDESARGVALAVGTDEARLVTVTGANFTEVWQRTVATFSPTDVLVDTFPEGLEVPLDPGSFPSAKWVALLRCRRDSASERFERALEGYTKVYDLEPGLDWAPRCSIPFGSVVREMSRVGQPEAIGADVVLIATELRHKSFLARLGAHLTTLGHSVRSYPGPSTSRFDAELLDADVLGAKVVVGPAGYNLTYELAALGVWHLALPVPRQYDCQELRASRVAVTVNSPDAAERRVLAWLEHGAPRPPTNVRTMLELARELVA